jgi:hypothetical protein
MTKGLLRGTQFRAILSVMHIMRKTNQELAVIDSSIWVSALLLCAAVPVVYASIAHGRLSGLWVAGFFVLCAFLFWRKEVVVFDAGRQQATWWRRRAFKTASGMVPFSEITGIGMEVTAAGEHGTLTYRLTILTSDKPVPMSDVYNSNRTHYETLKAEISQFLHIENGEASTSRVGDENSIQSLLKQGRKIDAIQLVRESQKIGLTEAVNRVNEIDEKMKAAK